MTQQCNNCIQKRSFSFFAILELDDCVHALAEKRGQGGEDQGVRKLLTFRYTLDI